MINKIRSEAQHQQVVTLVEAFIEKATKQGGFHSLSKEENIELEKLSLLIEAYENQVLKIMPLPVTVPDVVIQKARELKLNQQKLAELFGMGTAKISQILSGKRQPDISFLKAVHEKLGIDGNFLLETITV